MPVEDLATIARGVKEQWIVEETINMHHHLINEKSKNTKKMAITVARGLMAHIIPAEVQCMDETTVADMVDETQSEGGE